MSSWRAPSGVGRRIALLGGGFSTDADGLLDGWVLARARRSRPRVCFVPTASGDAEGYVDRFEEAFAGLDAETSVLRLFRRTADHTALRAGLLDQDVIYVGGGNTVNLLAVWRAHGVDRVLREALDRGTLLCGISAGANCWAEGSHTDSYGPLTHLPDGLGLLPGSVCPHYDGEPGRRSSYLRAVARGELPPGWALDDGVGALFVDGVLVEAVTRAPRAGVWRVAPDGRGGAVEEPAGEIRPLTGPGGGSGG
ncbi:Type 1 glutamine amidotransferase-like domain-containing protein [Streptomyces sp. NPDC091281]|uniref:Type 1 glutamine amidotransferase-like domain-containing protein n=1 Tax=Streptomyces sp. NPDC091281 TaxID=3365985 RepID=UPI00380D9BB6